MLSLIWYMGGIWPSVCEGRSLKSQKPPGGIADLPDIQTPESKVPNGTRVLFGASVRVGQSVNPELPWGFPARIDTVMSNVTGLKCHSGDNSS